MRLNELQAQVVAYLFEQLPLEDPVDTLDFSLNGEFKERFVCIEAGVQGTASDTSLVASLPSYSNTVFIAFTRGHGRETALVLANLEDYLRETRRTLAAGDVLVLPADQAATGCVAPYAVMLMHTHVSPELENLPGALDLPAGAVNLFVALGLDEQEHICLKEQGFNVLMDQFAASGKDLFMS